MLAENLGVAPMNCHGEIIGEHGDSSIPVWSGVTISGVRLRDLKPTFATPEDDENMGKVHKEVVAAAYKIIELKAYTNWAIGLCVAELTRAVLEDIASIHEVSVCVKGYHGINDEVYLSLPGILDVRAGITFGDVIDR